MLATAWQYKQSSYEVPCSGPGPVYRKEGSILKKELQNLLINYCGKCYAGEIPMLKYSDKGAEQELGSRVVGGALQ